MRILIEAQNKIGHTLGSVIIERPEGPFRPSDALYMAEAWQYVVSDASELDGQSELFWGPARDAALAGYGKTFPPQES